MMEINDKFDFDHSRIKERLAATYLEQGSVNALLNQFPEVPEATAHRWLDSYDIVKQPPGRNPNAFGPILYFLSSWLNAGKVPLETFYRKHLPPSMKEAVSMSSLHRTVAHIYSLTTRLSATSLILTPQAEPHQILVGHDITASNPAVGKAYGALTLPMTYSKTGEDPYLAVKRVLQQEAFSNLVLKKQFPGELIPEKPKPFMNVVVADVNVAVYHLELPWQLLDQLQTPKLTDLHFMPLTELVDNDPLDTKIRSGIVEMATGHLIQLEKHQEPLTWALSRLNEQLALAKV